MTLILNAKEDFDSKDPLSFVKMISSYARYRLKHNKNFILCICGGTGSGKSLSALYIAQLIQEEMFKGKEPFKANQVCFTGTEFMKLVQNLPSDRVIIWDEIGVGLNSRRSMSNVNIAINSVFQTFRHQRYAVILTTPDFGYIDKATRKLLHMYCDTIKIDFEKGLNQIKLLQCQNNPRMGKVYFKVPILKVPGEGSFKMPYIYTGLPDKELIEDYEERKKSFTDNLNEKVESLLSEDDQMSKLTQRQRDVWELNQTGYKNVEIAEMLGMHDSVVSKIITSCSAKLQQRPRVNYSGAERSRNLGDKKGNIVQVLQARRDGHNINFRIEEEGNEH